MPLKPGKSRDDLLLEIIDIHNRRIRRLILITIAVTILYTTVIGIRIYKNFHAPNPCGETHDTL